MIKNKYFLFLVSFMIIFFGFSQESDEKLKKQVEFAERMTYDIGSNLFKEPKMKFESVISDTLPWDKKSYYSHQQLSSALDSLEINAEIVIESSDFSGITLNIKSYFPAYIKNAQDIFRISIIESILSSTEKNKVKVDNTPIGVFYGNKFHSISNNGENTSYNWETINCSFRVRTDNSSEDIKGDIKFSVEFASKVDYVKIVSKDIGKEFTLNNKKYKVVNIIHNKVIIAPTDVTAEIDRTIDFLNIDKSGNKIDQIAMTSMSEQSDETIRYSEVSTSTITKNIYDIFEMNPEITMEAYQHKMHSSFIELAKAPQDKENQLKNLGPQYIIFESAGPIHDFYLYTPKFDLEKEFTVKL